MAPNGYGRGRRWVHKAAITSSSTGAISGSRKSGFRESTQNSIVRSPSPTSSLLDCNAYSRGFIISRRWGRSAGSRTGMVRHSSTSGSRRACDLGPSSMLWNVLIVAGSTYRNSP